MLSKTQGVVWFNTYSFPLQDECSFVSLRDVERAMIVFEYFFDKMDIFGPRMNEMAARIDREMEDVEEVCLPVCLSPVYM